MIRAAVILAAIVGSGGLLLAQAAPPAPPALVFEAASVKRNPDPEARFASPRFQGVTFTAANVGVEMLITAAYGIQSQELIEAPAWISLARFGERYDVVAKAPDGSSRQDMQAMLRHLLETRFALRLRRETRERPIYVLTTVDEGAALGPNLRRAVKDCLPRASCESRVGGGGGTGTGAQWSAVLQAIALGLDRRVADRTGLSGPFDFELTYRQGMSTNPDDPAVDIFTAVRQQLGLKLEPGRAPFEVGVVDSVSRPTPD